MKTTPATTLTAKVSYGLFHNSSKRAIGVAKLTAKGRFSLDLNEDGQLFLEENYSEEILEAAIKPLMEKAMADGWEDRSKYPFRYDTETGFEIQLINT